QTYADAGNGNGQFQAENLPPATNYHGPMSRQQIADLQWQLAVHGYDPGASDGTVGPRTEEAIQQYQADAGLPADGQPSPTLLEHLQYTDPPVLNRNRAAQAQGQQPNYGAPSEQPDDGDNGPPYDNGDNYARPYDNGDNGGYGQPELPPTIGVAPSLMQVYTATVQEELGRRGYYRGPVDGVPGGQTRAAIRDFQEDNGLPVTGEVSLELVNYLRLVTTAAAPN